MRKFVIPVLAFVAVLTTTPAAAATISFAALPVGTFDGALALGGATFTSNTGKLYIGAAGGDRAVCAFANRSCAGALTINFATAVDNLSFFADGDDFARSQVFVTGTAASGVFSLASGGFDGNVYSFAPVDLSGIAGVTSITLTSDDIKGLGYDNFSFDQTSAAVPEPATWAMMLGGLGLVGGAMRRRSRGVVAA